MDPAQEIGGHFFGRFQVGHDDKGIRAVLDQLHQLAHVVGRQQLGQLVRNVHRGHKGLDGVYRCSACAVVRPQVVTHALNQLFLFALQVSVLLERVFFGAGGQALDELNTVACDGNHFVVNAHLAARSAGISVHQQQRHFGVHVGVQRRQVALHARELLRNLVGQDLIDAALARLQQVQIGRDLNQQVVQVFFQRAGQNLRQRFATQVRARGFAQGAQIAQKRHDHIHHVLAIFGRHFFGGGQGGQDVFDAGVQARVALLGGGLEHPAQGAANVVGHAQNLRWLLLGGNRGGQLLEHRQAVLDQAQEHRFFVTGL